MGLFDFEWMVWLDFQHTPNIISPQSKKAPKEEVDAQVAILLDLKKQLTTAGGVVANGKGKDDKKKPKQQQPPPQKSAPVAKEAPAAPAAPVRYWSVLQIRQCCMMKMHHICMYPSYYINNIIDDTYYILRKRCVQYNVHDTWYDINDIS